MAVTMRCSELNNLRENDLGVERNREIHVLALTGCLSIRSGPVRSQMELTGVGVEKVHDWKELSAAIIAAIDFSLHFS